MAKVWHPKWHGSADCVTLIVAHTQTITSFQKGSPFRGRWGSWLLKSSFWVSRAPLCVIWHSLLLTACPFITYHTVPAKASDKRIQCQILGQDWAIQPPGEVRLATQGAAASWGQPWVAVLGAAGGWGSLQRQDILWRVTACDGAKGWMPTRDRSWKKQLVQGGLLCVTIQTHNWNGKKHP